MNVHLLSSDAQLWYATDALGSVPTFGFTGELQQGANVYLRARWYNAGRGVFSSRDPFAGMPEQPYSLMPYQYSYSAPTTWTDASGAMPCSPPLCGYPLDRWALQQLVGDAKQFYDKNGTNRHCTTVWPDDGQHDLTDTVSDLFTDYVCEYGSASRVYPFNARLTKELSRSNLVAELRREFYLTGKSEGGPSQMGGIGFIQGRLDALSDCTYTVFAGLPACVSITDFLGGLDFWRVTKDSFQGRDTVRFELYNETTLRSGTRIPFVDAGVGAISLEEYLQNPGKYNQSGGNEVNLRNLDSRFRIATILQNRSRAETVDGAGGGTMSQRFLWEETYLSCFQLNLPAFLVSMELYPTSNT